jgi:GNAT superfamily N-acetyltransferase
MFMIKIRLLHHSDFEGWSRLWRGYLEFYETVLGEDIYHTTFGRLIDPACAYQNAFVAGAEGRLIGLVHYIFHAHNWRTEDVIYLQDLYVDPSVRGTGVGRKLIEAVYRAADENETPNVYWMTQDCNTTARQLYDRIGQLTPFIKYQR